MMRVVKIGIGMVALGLSTAWLGVRPTPLLFTFAWTSIPSTRWS
jgi:hypothetical protein